MADSPHESHALRGGGSGGAAGKREQADVAALIRERGEILHVPITVEVTGEVRPAQIEEHALHEQVDELVEQSTLEALITLDELDRAQDVVLL